MSLYQIWTDESYVYAATASGLDIIDIDTEQRTSFLSNASGYKSVWSNTDLVFLASSAGVKVIYKDNLTQVHNYMEEPDLLSNNVRYIHGNESKLICGTEGGITVVKRDAGFMYGTSVSGVQKCFITPVHNYCYYTVSGTSEWQLHRVNNPTSSWTESTRVYTTGSGFLENVTCLTDFYATEHTSTSGVDNTLFIATNSGVYVYDEGTTDYSIFTTTLLAGTSEDATSVWADPNASLETAKLYVGTTGSGAAFSVIDLEHTVLTDSYKIDYDGINEEFLDREDIVDINVSTAGA